MTDDRQALYDALVLALDVVGLFERLLIGMQSPNWVKPSEALLELELERIDLTLFHLANALRRAKQVR